MYYEVLFNTQEKRHPSPYIPLNPSYSLKIILLCDVTAIAQYRPLNDPHKGLEMYIKHTASSSPAPVVLFQSIVHMYVELISLPWYLNQQYRARCCNWQISLLTFASNQGTVEWGLRNNAHNDGNNKLGVNAGSEKVDWGQYINTIKNNHKDHPKYFFKEFISWGIKFSLQLFSLNYENIPYVD